MRHFAIPLALALGLVTGPAPAEPPAFKDFTFKRVKPPAPGAKKRIDVQITAEEFAAQSAPPPKPATAADPTHDVSDAIAAEAATPRAPSGFEWFWAQLSPGIGENPANRARDALTLLAEGPAGTPVAGPRLETLRKIADAYGADILKATIGTRVSPAFALAVISVESGGRHDAVSHAGARGLMQLMPATADRFGVSDSLVAAQNIRGGVTYLDWLMGEFGDDPVLALAGYNAGEGAVKRHAGVPPYPETRAYVPKVLAAWSVARGLCLTPPELFSDGCVFVGPRSVTNG
ncbi:lytic transglycosylase domain-containing protein [Mesobaculum littorinae]|uniref:Lytic transglycosylase domain-containing protein n=1 Tax=Mesobaculum littorinae TaxID=2486419 RepID=A0A438AIE2_9RHOB|nr:lytic transglycosylase domain-containing protein [Mesobaculum littorinae]RVV98521.1 lytic transglycosylase domain-containing protein [Mesobaculum littorinae]